MLSHPASFIIRPAIEKDLPSIYDFVCALEAFAFNYVDIRAVFRQNLKSSSSIYLVAEYEGRVVGFVSLHIQNLLHHCGRVGELQEFFVSKQHRRMGIGKALLDAASKEAAEENCLSLEVTANCARRDAHAFYQANGLQGTHKKFVKPLAHEKIQTN